MTFADCIGDGIQFYLTFFTCFSYPVNYKFDCLPFKFIQSQELYLTDSMINFTLYYASYFSCMLVSKPEPILNMVLILIVHHKIMLILQSSIKIVIIRNS